MVRRYSSFEELKVDEYRGARRKLVVPEPRNFDPTTAPRMTVLVILRSAKTHAVATKSRNTPRPMRFPAAGRPVIWAVTATVEHQNGFLLARQRILSLLGEPGAGPEIVM